MTTYSHSKLGTFQQCKYKYKLKYIDKVKVEEPTTIEAFMGDMVHRTLHKLYLDLQHGKLCKKEELLLYFDSIWDKNWDDKILINKKEYDYKELGKKFVTDYYEHYKPFNHLRTLGLETEERFDLSNGDKYHIRMDRLACDKEGNYYICDYKTNNKLKAQEELDEDRQLAMYSLWVRKNFKDCKSVKLVWYFLAFDKEMVSERSEEQVAQLKAQTEALIQEIVSCTEFPVTTSNLCSWCVYKSICPAWKHEFMAEERIVGEELVDRYVQALAKKKGAEEEASKLKDQIVLYAVKHKLSAVLGTEKRAKVTPFKKVVLPDNFKELLKEKGIYDEYSMLSHFKLQSAILKGQLDKELVKKVEKVEEYKVSVGRK